MSFDHKLVYDEMKSENLWKGNPELLRTGLSKPHVAC